MEKDFGSILKSFMTEGRFVSAERYGHGHINDTYLALFDADGRLVKYILQRINSRLFKDVPALMRNIELVTEFNRKKILERGGDPYREGLMIVRTTDGKAFYFDGEDYYRVYIFIDYATSHQTVTKPEHFYESAVAFGNFSNLLAEFDASQLTETIPDFHNTRKRFTAFCTAVEKDAFKRASGVQKEIEWVKSREKYADAITKLLDSGAIPYRVTHNDTKLNNVMIDDETGKGLAVIDLDTIMPGSLCYDFGDSIRFGCNPAEEGERDLSKVVFQTGLFEEYVKGYLSAVGNSITPMEKDNLAMGAIVMTYECGTRFLTDYLSGDTYFRTTREGQNLDRARTQFKLVEDMEMLYNKLKDIVNRY